MLYPILTDSRFLSDLSGIWRFQLDNGHGFEEKWYERPMEDAMNMPVPSSYNDLKEGIDFREHYGWVRGSDPQGKNLLERGTSV